MVGNLCQSNYSEIFYMENEEERNPFYFLFVSIFPLQREKKKSSVIILHYVDTLFYGKQDRHSVVVVQGDTTHNKIVSLANRILRIYHLFYYLFSNFRNWICAGLFFILYHGSNVKNRWGLLILLEIRGGCRGTPWILCQLFNQSLIRVMLTRRLLDFLLLYYPHTLLFSFIDFILSFNKYRNSY